MTSPLQGNGAMVAILADPGYSMKECFAFAIRLLFLKQRVTSMLDYATLLGKILLMCGLTREQYLLHTTSLEKKELREYILKRRRNFGYNFVKNVMEVVRYWYKCTQDARNWMNEDGEPPAPDTVIDPNQPIYGSFDTWIKRKGNVELVRSCFQTVEDFWPSSWWYDIANLAYHQQLAGVITYMFPEVLRAIRMNTPREELWKIMKPLMLAGDIDTYNIPCIAGHPAVMKGIQEGKKRKLFYKIPQVPADKDLVPIPNAGSSLDCYPQNPDSLALLALV